MAISVHALIGTSLNTISDTFRWKRISW